MQGTLPRFKPMLIKLQTNPKPNFAKIFFLLSVLISVILSSCNNDILIPSVTPSVTPQPSATSEPTHTSTPIPKNLILLLSDKSFPSLSSTILTTVQELSREEDWEVRETNHLDFDVIPPNLRLLISLPPDPGIQDLALQNPDIQFLAIGMLGLEPQQNLSILAGDGFPIDQQAFIAGYASAVLTKDWRIGLIAEVDSEAYQAINESFINGVIYYCGLCRLAYPPFHNYPITTQLSPGSVEEEWMTAADLLLSYSVDTIFIYSYEPSLSTLEYLAGKGIALIGIQDPTQELALSSWRWKRWMD